METKPETGQKRKQEEPDPEDTKRHIPPSKVYYNVEDEAMRKSVVLDSNFIKLNQKIDEICQQFSNAVKDQNNDKSSIKSLVIDATSTIVKRKVDNTTLSLNGPMGSGI